VPGIRRTTAAKARLVFVFAFPWNEFLVAAAHEIAVIAVKSSRAR
jgi:hypothetical protein